MAKVTIYHNPKCVTCKKVIDAVRKAGGDTALHDFMKEPLSEKELAALLKKAGVKPSAALRKRDKMFKELGFDTKTPTDAQALKAMAKHPGLILRPIVVAGRTAAVAPKPDEAAKLA